jgi:uncharacterized membrane protein YfcA
VTLLDAITVLAAGIAAGTINTVVGSGTLITFPVLLAVGYSPVVANVSNSIGLVPGSVSGAIGYRRELVGQGARLKLLVPASALGGICGAIALLTLPDDLFTAIVPVMIALALVLIVAQPRLSAIVASHRPAGRDHGPWLWFATFACGIYGGYFGAAQGIILVSLFAVAIADNLQRLNAIKNVLAGLVNLIAGLLFIFVADVAWGPVGLIAIGSLLGGIIGARYGRRLPPGVLRALIVFVGLFAIIRLLVWS